MKLAKAILKAKRVYICGNGGSAANASHIANDLVACGVKAQALTDAAMLSATANDYSYGAAFSVQLKVLAEPGDLVIALSGSGRSPNILTALATAKEMGVESWAIVGAFNADIPAANIADHCTKWGKDMQDAEEKQLSLGHKVFRYLRGDVKK